MHDGASGSSRTRTAALLAVCAAVLLGCTPEPPAPARNAILISIDTLRPDHLGCYGYGRDTSPNLDKLAARSVRFDRALSVSSWTLPSHASLLTGLYPAEHGVRGELNALPPSANTIGRLLRKDGFDTFAAVSHPYLSRRWGFDNGFAGDFDESEATGSTNHPVASGVVDSAIEWLDRRSDDRRFFMWLHIFDPHWDYDPPSPYDSLFDPDYQGTTEGKYVSIKPYIKAVAGYEHPPPLAERDLEHIIALYDGEIAYVDANLGRLFSRLAAAGLDRDTVILVVADHGEEFMEHGSLEGHQWTLYEEVVRVPLIVYVPGLEGGRVVTTVVSTVGVAPTVLDLLGVDGVSSRAAARSLAGNVLRTGTRPGAAALLDLTVRGRNRQVALHDGDYKLIRYHDGRNELYANPEMGNEHTNLANDKPAVVAEMSAEIDRRLEAMSPLPDAGAQRQSISNSMIERLRATGYID